MQLDPDSVTAVSATLESYAASYGRKDVDGLVELFAEDSEVHVIGTAVHQRSTGKAQIREHFERNFAEAEHARFEWIARELGAVGRDGAWVAGDAIVHISIQGKRKEIPVRFTVVLERRGERWVWLHRHASVAAPTTPDLAYPRTYTR